MSGKVDFSRQIVIISCLFLACFTISFSTAVSRSLCPRLLPKKGVEIQCSRFTANQTEINRPCTIRSPSNTIVKFNCKPYFTSVSAILENGIMRCDRKGRWRNFTNFQKFKCHLSADGWINQVVDTNRVVIFSLSYCGYCHQIKKIFQDLRVKYFAIELDLIDYRKATLLKDALLRKTGMKTYPNVFVHGQHVGGFDKTTLAYHYGTLQTLLNSTFPISR